VNAIPSFRMAPPKGAFYSFIKFDGPWKDDPEFVRGLLKHGVVVVPGSGFAPRMEDKAFRLVFLPKPDQLEEAFDRIDRYMKSVKG